MRPLLPLSGSSGFPGCVRILNKKGKARSKLIFQHQEEMLFPASYKTGANKTDTGAHCPANNVVMGDERLRKQTSGRRARLIFPHKCECECVRGVCPGGGLVRLAGAAPPLSALRWARSRRGPERPRLLKFPQVKRKRKDREKDRNVRKGEARRREKPRLTPRSFYVLISSPAWPGFGSEWRASVAPELPGPSPLPWNPREGGCRRCQCAGLWLDRWERSPHVRAKRRPAAPTGSPAGDSGQ